ncbi:MAG: MBL fold metallo-hydrolase [Candidatus Pacebacteria bacterium]|nr:MBL fold metallo-hydrolase [Candidatus Paceibacterota bacterium]
MFQGSKKYLPLLSFLLILLSLILILHLNIKDKKDYLTFAMLNVGQGDALFIESPTGTQILIDGGPPRKILSRLSRVMPLFDKSIDAIIITNPDLDHIGGFLDVLKVYKVGQVYEAGTWNESKTYENLKNKIKEKNIPISLAQKGMRIKLGGGAVLDILFPDRDVSTWTTNDGSVVARLTYGETSVMLTGDATSETEKLILGSNPISDLDIDILKIAHHGSRTSTSDIFVEAVSPEYALISSDGGKKYGHPHKETLDTLNSFGSKIFRTDLLGTIIMKSDGLKETFSFLK